MAPCVFFSYPIYFFFFFLFALIETGLIDHSGMRIRLVSKLRKHDAAIMELGLEYTDKMAIPPGVLGFPLSGYCIAECTQTVIYDFLDIFI